MKQNDIINTIEKYFDGFAKKLLDHSRAKLITYQSKVWLNNEILVMEQLKNIEGNVYCIFIGREGIFEPVYVGERESNSIKQRLREHLIKKHAKTGSQLKNVQTTIESGYSILINTVLIKPDYLRHSLEKYIISQFKHVLIWNIHRR